jgi:tetratricopeptide (TPR) repeat protein
VEASPTILNNIAELLEDANITRWGNPYGKDDSEMVESLIDLSNYYGVAGNHKKQSVLLKKALNIGEKSKMDPLQLVFILIELGNVYGQLGNLSKQCEVLERALIIIESSNIELPAFLESLAGIYDNMGNYARTCTLLEKSLNIKRKNPSDPSIHDILLKLADVYYLNQQIDKAISSYQQGLENKDSPAAYMGYQNLECAYHVNNQCEEAEKCFKKSMQLRPDSNICAEYAHFLYMQGRYKEAVPLLNQQIKLKDSPKLLYGPLDQSIIVDYLRESMTKKNTVEIEAALLAHHLLVLCYCALGDMAASKNALDNFKEVIPSDIEISQSDWEQCFNYTEKCLKEKFAPTPEDVKEVPISQNSTVLLFAEKPKTKFTSSPTPLGFASTELNYS